MSQKALTALRKNQGGTFGLQITSMIDMFTIILVFLLKSYASSSIDMSSNKNVVLPASSASQAPIEALKLVVSKEGIYVDDKLVSAMNAGVISASDIDKKDERFVTPLYQALKAQAEKTKAISAKNADVNFEGKIIFQADQGLSYQTIRKVMYTSSFAGYTDFKFAVVSNQ